MVSDKNNQVKAVVQSKEVELKRLLTDGPLLDCRT